MKVETRDHLRKMYHEKLRPMEMYSLTLSRLDVIFDMTVLELQIRTETKIYELNVPMSVLGLGESTKTYDLSCPRAKCHKNSRHVTKEYAGQRRPGVLFLRSR